jgi:secreted trypsin-like serine protease
MKLNSAASLILLTASYDKTMADAMRNMQNIVGGDPSTEGDFPYFTAHSDFWCGASLIHEDMLLTAAHCKGIWDEVRIGVHNASDPNDGVVRRVTKEIIHPNYLARVNDIMLLKLESPVSIQPVAWETSENSPSSGETLTVMGFGLTSEKGSESSVLRQVDVLTVDDETCKTQYDGYHVDVDVEFCAGVPNGGKDSCQGDSGEYCNEPLFLL